MDALPRIEYAKRRKDAAKGLGITLAELDKIVAEARGETSAATPERWSIAPWDTAIDTAELLLQHAARAMALWTLHASALDAAHVSPLPHVFLAGDAVRQEHRRSVLYRTAPRRRSPAISRTQRSFAMSRPHTRPADR